MYHANQYISKNNVITVHSVTADTFIQTADFFICQSYKTHQTDKDYISAIGYILSLSVIRHNRNNGDNSNFLYTLKHNGNNGIFTYMEYRHPFRYAINLMYIMLRLELLSNENKLHIPKQ